MDISSLRYWQQVQLTPEYVLDVEKEFHQYQCALGRSNDDELILTFDTTVWEWLFAGDRDLIPNKYLGQWFNYFWDMNASDKEWETVLKDCDTSTVGDVCHFIAERGKKYSVNSSHLLGANCLKGGIFLAIKELLKQEGVNVRHIKPSTPIHYYMEDYEYVLLHRFACRFPGRLPLIKPGYGYSSSCLSDLIFITLAASPLLFPYFMGASLNWFGGYFLYLMAIYKTKNSIDEMFFAKEKAKYTPREQKIHWDGIVTFRDFVECLAQPEAKHRYGESIA